MCEGKRIFLLIFADCEMDQLHISYLFVGAIGTAV